MTTVPPTAVLSDAVGEAIDGRTVRAAVFTTFTFDPGFFEEHVLPLLFDRPFSQVRKVRMIQLEDALKELDSIAVYYDRTALLQESEPAQLDVRRIDVRRSRGVFHPKVMLFLVEDEEDEEVTQSLVVGVASANLTRAGWWENVEAFHFEEIEDKAVHKRRCPFRSDLLSLILQIRRSAPADEKHEALDLVHRFLRDRVRADEFETRSAGGHYRTRLFMGHGSLADFFADLRPWQDYWNLEIISPYFDKTDAGSLKELLEVIRPRECRVYLPEDSDGAALVDPKLYAKLTKVANWGRLPASVSGRAGAERRSDLAPRRVHAKVYRLWSDDNEEFFLVGSPNLTRAAHSDYRQGNLEAAFLVDPKSEGHRGWWLASVEAEVTEFSERAPSEDEASETVPVDISFRFDWETATLTYRVDGPTRSLEIAEPSGRSLFRIDAPVAGAWTELDAVASQAVRELLASTSFLLARQGDHSWRVLIREERMAYKPSLLTTLTPEEILQYWSLLSPEQRADFLEEKLRAEAQLEGLPAGGHARFVSSTTMFDRFAGLFHAFQCLREHVAEALEQEEWKEAEARLFGEKYDSLPVLLHKVLEREREDPVMAYVTFLCAKQARDRLRGSYPGFWAERTLTAVRLDRKLANLPRLRGAIPLDADGFFDWYEEMFLEEIPVAEEAEE